jgi:hypothetical protein
MVKTTDPERGPDAWKRAAPLDRLTTLVVAILSALYIALFGRSVRGRWLSADWTTDDAFQQSFPLHKALDPDLFQNDLVTRMMEGYLTPLHYWVSYALTSLTGDPVVAGHWVASFQILLTSAFVFGAVRRLAGSAPAFFAVAWFFHSRGVIQRMSGGLPRGWAGPVLAGYLSCIAIGSHRGVLAVLAVGALLHPPSVFLATGAYALLLLWRLARGGTRAETVRPALSFALVVPIVALVTWLVVRMPPELGTMVDYETALLMPEFSEKGRFPFTPLRPVSEEGRLYAFQPFIFRQSPPLVPAAAPFAPFAAVLLFALFLFAKRGAGRPLVEAGFIAYLTAALLTYLLSRQVAFKLYVPNRHLQIPLALFFITSFSAAAWNWAANGAAFREKEPVSKPLRGALALTALALLVAVSSGSGLEGTANVSIERRKYGKVHEWLERTTPKDALVAGDPTIMNPVPLFAKRKAYISTETAHPFYDKYYQESKRRMELSIRAHYASSLREFLSIVEPERISYFIFRRRQFYPKALAKSRYPAPFDRFASALTSTRPVEQFAYRELPSAVDMERAPYMPFKDEHVAVVDVAALRRSLGSR